MSKEYMEALERVRENISEEVQDDLTLFLIYRDLDIIEEALERLDVIDNTQDKE